MNSIKKWFFVTRPWSFVVSATPVILTIVFIIWKGGLTAIDWLNAILALVGIIVFHAAGNVISDYYDYKTGIDNPDAFCIPNLISGEFKAEDYRKYAYILFAVGIAIGILLTVRVGWPLLLVGVPGFILTYLYSRLKFIALGDLNIFILFGVLPMLGTSFVTIGMFEWSTLLLSVPVGIVTVAVLHANNTRDIPTDSKAGAKSFAYVIGKKASVRAYQAYMWIPCIYTVAMVACRLFPVWCLLILLSLPIVTSNTRQAQKYFSEGLPAFNTLDLRAAKLQMISGISLALGFVVPVVLDVIL